MLRVNCCTSVPEIAFQKALERCNPWPRVANRHITISQLLPLWRHSHFDGYGYAYGARSPRSHYAVIRYWTVHAHRYGRTYVRYGHLTAYNI